MPDIRRDIYEKHLHYCRNCDNMVNGMRRHCGGFVEVGAAGKMNRCVKSPALWQAYGVVEVRQVE